MEDTIMEERLELVVSSKLSGPINPTQKLSPFLKPSATSVDNNVKPISSNPPFDPKASSLKVSFYGFRTMNKGWKEWVNSMCSLHKSTWQKAGIYDAVLNSSYEIIKDDDLILGFAKKWCHKTKTFVFKWGEVTITLEDMMVVGGYSVLGQSVLNLADTETDESKAALEKLYEARLDLQRSRRNKADQSGWLTKFKDSGSDIEQEAFLALWLSRFVFPSSYSTVTKNALLIAVHLSRGLRLALAPPVLASVYRDLRLLKNSLENHSPDDETKVIVWAPFQLVQVWIWERVRKISPNCVNNCDPKSARWEKKKVCVKDVGSFVDCGFDDFTWQAYGEDINDKSGKWIVVGDCLDVEMESWVRCLRVSELVGIGGKCIQQYLPHRVAMQFGMNQDVPGDVARMNGSSAIAWRFYTRPVKDVKIYFPSRFSEPCVTVRYLEWWNKSPGECSLQSPFVDNDTEKFGNNESRIGKSSDSMDDDVDIMGSDLDARISKLEEIFAYLKARKNGEN